MPNSRGFLAIIVTTWALNRVFFYLKMKNLKQHIRNFCDFISIEYNCPDIDDEIIEEYLEPICDSCKNRGGQSINGEYEPCLQCYK